MTGIVSYGAYIPRWRLPVEDIAAVWRKDPGEIAASLGVSQKSVAAIDEDAVTMALEAAQQMFDAAPDVKPEAIGALLVGSESHPYAVNPTSTIVGEFLGVGNEYLAADMQFACKAGTAGMQAVTGLVSAGHIDYGIAIGTDKAESKPHDSLEYASASASAAYLLGNKRVIAEIAEYVSYSSDTPDFWRRDGIRFPTHAGRFTGEPGYFRHVMGSVKLLLEKTGLTPGDFAHAVFHMPNGKFPRDAGKRLGFTPEQLKYGLTVDLIGNPYSASSLIGLASILDHARPGELVLLVSYGSGAGSDGFVFRMTDALAKVREKRGKRGILVEDFLLQATPISYTEYLRKMQKI